MCKIVRKQNRITKPRHKGLRHHSHEADSNNYYMEAFMRDLRYGPCSPRNIEAPMTYDDVIHRLPISVEDQHATLDAIPTAAPLPVVTPIAGDEHAPETGFGIEFDDVIYAHSMISAHHCLPNYTVEALPWKACSYPWLHLPIGMAPWAGEWHFYMDGSKRGPHSGAGCVAFFCDGCQWYFGGWLGIQLAGVDSYDAEVIATTLAAKWTWDLLKVHPLGTYADLQVFFHYDNISAGEGALGHFACTRKHAGHDLVRAFLQLIRAGYGIGVQGVYQASHIGEPGNEMADVIASFASQHSQPDDDFWRRTLTLEQSALAEWFWLLYRSDLTPFWMGTRLCLQRAHAEMDRKVLVDAQPVAAKVDSFGSGDLRIGFASYNPMSLKNTKRKGVGSVGLVELTLRQFFAAGVQVFSLQETRLRRKVGALNPHFFVFQGLADSKGHGGTMMAFAKTLPIGTVEGKEVFFHDNDFKIVTAEPDLLIIKVTNQLWRGVCVNVHCPHSGNTDEVIRAWWSHIQRQLQPFQSDDLVFMGDVNGRIGAVQTEAVGGLRPDDETLGGTLFHDFMLRWGLWSPATFPSCHEGRTSTWISPQGQESRIDYVAVTQRWRHFCVKSRPLDAISVRDFVHDHGAILVTIEGPLQVSIHKVSKRYSPKRKVFGTGDIQKLRLSLQTIPPVRWDLDVHRHAEQLHRQVKERVRQSLGDSKKYVIKSFIQSDTWALIREKQQLRKAYFALGQQCKRNLLQVCFDVWMNRVGPERLEHDVNHRAHFERVDNLKHFKTLSNQVQTMLRRDEQAFFENLCSNIKDADHPGTQRRFWASIRRMLPRFAERRHQVRAHQIFHLQDEWGPHLCSQEAGIPMPLEEVYLMCTKRQNNQNQTQLDRYLLPSLCDIENLMRKVRGDRVGGPDGLDPSWIKYGAACLGPHVFDLCLKILAWQCEPVQYKGGILSMIPKRPSPTTADQFRGVMLSSTIAKCLHSHLRKPLMAALEPLRPPGQIGGFAHKECGYGAQTIRSLTKVCQKTKTPCSLLFVDLRAAYHSLVRQLVVGHMEGEDTEWKILEATLEAETGARGVRLWLQEGGILQRLGVQPQLIAILQELNINEWTYLAGSTYLTGRGSRPGSPIADALFHALMLDITWQLEHFCAQHFPIPDKLRQLGVEIHAIVWADDLVLPIVAEDSSELVSCTKLAAGKVFESFNSRGFNLNLGKGKTEIVPTMVGEGAPLLRQDLLRQETPQLEVTLTDGTQQSIRWQGRYRHLGAQQESGGGMSSEIDARRVSAWTTFTKLSKGLLCCPKYNESTRMRLLDVLVFTKLFYAAGTWPPLPRRLMQKLHRTYVQMVRRVKGLCSKPDVHFSDRFVLTAAGLPDLRIKLAGERLLYAARFFRHADSFMHRMAAAEDTACPDSWMAGLRADYDWLSRVLDCRWGHTLDEAIQAWQTGAPRWKSFVRRGIVTHCLQQTIARKLQRFFPKAEGNSEEEEGFLCKCGNVFPTKRAWAMHATVKHHRRTTLYDFEGTVCWICMREFWTTPRLRQHLGYIPKGLQSNRCEGLARHYLCYGEPHDKKPPLSGLRRRERIRLAGPLHCGVDEQDLDYICQEKGRLKALLHISLLTMDFSALADGDTMRDLEELYQNSQLDNVQELLDLNELTEQQKLVTCLLWGHTRIWNSSDERWQWRCLIDSFPGGADLNQWFVLEQLAALIENLEEKKEHSQVPITKDGGLNGKRLEISIYREVDDIAFYQVEDVLSAHDFFLLKQPLPRLSALRNILSSM